MLHADLIKVISVDVVDDKKRHISNLKFYNRLRAQVFISDNFRRNNALRQEGSGSARCPEIYRLMPLHDFFHDR